MTITVASLASLTQGFRPMTGSIGKFDKQPVLGPLVEQLANSVIGNMASAPSNGQKRRVRVAAKTLYLAACSDRAFSNARVLDEMSALRVRDPDTLDACITEAAQHLGRDWLDDTASFASVSRASSRLFGLCKEIGQEWSNLRAHDHSRTILVATFGREDHLIGPTLLAQRLRRKGHSVLLLQNAATSDVGERLDRGDFDCLMVSSASQVGLENVETSFRTLVRHTKKKVPFVLGGAVLEFCDANAGNFGADLVTNDEDMALRVLTGSALLSHAGAAE